MIGRVDHAGSRSVATHHLLVALLATLLCITAPVAWSLALDVPWMRASGAPMWALLAVGVVLAVRSVRGCRRRLLRLLLGLDLGLLAACTWLFLGLTAVPPAITAEGLERAPDFTLPDDGGRPVTLAKELSHGPVLLVFYRGSWCMMCRSELRGLGAVSEVLAKRGGAVLAVSVDGPEPSRALIDSEDLRFRLLSDTSLDVVRRYGLLHAGGGPGGADIAVPALFLVRPDGRIAWRHVARRAQDRADPQEILAAIAAL